ncbi:MAG: Ig-like domain repeat protein [Pseudomonadota bacterium]
MGIAAAMHRFVSTLAYATVLAVVGMTGTAKADTWYKEVESGVNSITHGRGVYGCAIMAGALKCWGRNTYGELGDGTKIQRVSPVMIIPEGVTAVSTSFQSCAVVNNAVQCWGGNSSGELGDGTRETRMRPVPVPGTEGASAVSAGGGYSCAIVQGSLKCWGINAQGQLGNGTTTSSLTPIVIIDAGVTDISTNEFQTCAVVAGAAKCWGFNNYGQVGSDGSPTAVLSPRTMIASGVSQVATGDDHACAIVGQAVQCWGENYYGQIGDGSTTPNYTPVTVVSAGATAVSAGWGHTCAIVYGALQCWGHGPDIYSHTPQTVQAVATQVSSNHFTRILVDGAVYCAGEGGHCFPLATIDFAIDPAVANRGTSVPLIGRSTSPLPILFSSRTPDICSLNGNILTSLAGGTCTVAADQAGDANYQYGPTVIRSINIVALAQSIYFNMPSALIAGTSLTLTGSASSGLLLSYASTTPSVCAVDGQTLTAFATGLCSVAAIQGGNAVYYPAAMVVRNANVAGRAQTISFGMPATLAIGMPVTLSATASSGLSVSYSSATPAICTVSGTIVTPLAGGTCSVIANQAGNAVYTAAPSVTRSAAVSYPLLVDVGFLANPIISGEAATVTVKISPATTSGSVSFYVAGSVACSNVSLTKNGATCKLRKLAAGTYTVTVVYTNGAVTASGEAILYVIKA